ncbi:MAG: DUF167 family protein [Phycisphaerales bacterium]|nr:DUF167 family protein [Phycisphaerales bacterium]
MTTDGKDILLRIKAVPGASRDVIAELLGDRIKIRVAAPPAGGQANRAICKLLSTMTSSTATIESGHASALKSVRIAAVTPETVASTLGL